ncbi:unnamed protein product [Bursaphelenchus okinawaensis]|uniref:Tyrosine-protein kinase n=1 Tax=Bursaphelenchus okinawaensis TaxID=465554 RepID=A0A811K0Y7_9BILA|nr:unnamed protein product [Bursaphelenchus okinawaensis]CAG9088598.1 unnamed protein product [Bursaphelenchus okinawaensis]
MKDQTKTESGDSLREMSQGEVNKSKDGKGSNEGTGSNEKMPGSKEKIGINEKGKSKDKQKKKAKSAKRSKSKERTPANKRKVSGKSIEEEPQIFEQSQDEDEKKAKNNSYQTMISNELKALQQKSWYHGLMPRDEIEHILTHDGEFLVRKTEVGKKEAQNERLTLSVRWKNRVRHIVIKLNKENKWAFLSDCGFETVEKLISFYVAAKGEIQSEGTKLLTPAPRPEWYLLHEQIKTKKKLGNGHYGEVYLGELHMDDKVSEVAVKMLKGKMGKRERTELMKEAAIQRKLRHPNVVGLLGIAPTEEPFMVVIEFCPGGDLKGHLKNSQKEEPFLVLNKYVVDIAKGMEYLHGLEIIHRDLAARNCLLTADFCAKVSDFGLSVKKNEIKEQKKQKMAVKWLAPEVLRSYTFSKATDVWAFGIVMWEVYTRCQKDPYPDKSNADVRKMLMELKQRMDVPTDLPPHVQELMKECWAEKPYDRPSMKDAVVVLSGGMQFIPKQMKAVYNKFFN